MQIYLVGGAVRDKLLGLPIYDQDWVVVGATAEQMLDMGFQTVGKDFPVFLHPESKEEHALARTERKSGQGYTGFECYFSPDVTLEDDLLRRDLTINAIAEDENGNLIDPYGGKQDLENRVLRHVSPAFVEDPLRVLRIARFAAKLGHLGFTIAPETQQLLKQIVASGELDHLTPERVWQEWHKSLATPRPDRFLAELRSCHALQRVLPEIDNLFGVPQTEKWHPEIDTGIHTLMVAEQAAKLSDSLLVRFAAQLHDLGKGVTPEEEWPSHIEHEKNGLPLVKALCERVRVPNEYKELALAMCEHHTTVHRAEELRANTILKLLDKLDVWRKPEKLNLLLQACVADHKGRKGRELAPYPQKAHIERAYQAALSVEVQEIIKQGFKGPRIRDELYQRRLEAIKHSRLSGED